MERALLIISLLLVFSDISEAAIGAGRYGTKANGTTTCAPTLPTNGAGDIIVAFVVDHGTSGSTTLANWTNQGSIAASGGRFQVFTCVVSGTNCNSPSFASLTTRSECNVVAYAGVNLTTPMDVAASTRSNTVSANTGSATITTVTNGAMVIAAYASLSNAATWSAEAVATDPTISEKYDGANSSYCSLDIAEGLKATAGSTGASSATMSAWVANEGILMALRPAQAYTYAMIAGGVVSPTSAGTHFNDYETMIAGSVCDPTSAGKYCQSGTENIGAVIDPSSPNSHNYVGGTQSYSYAMVVGSIATGVSAIKRGVTMTMSAGAVAISSSSIAKQGRAFVMAAGAVANSASSAFKQGRAFVMNAGAIAASVTAKQARSFVMTIGVIANSFTLIKAIKKVMGAGSILGGTFPNSHSSVNTYTYAMSIGAIVGGLSAFKRGRAASMIAGAVASSGTTLLKIGKAFIMNAGAVAASSTLQKVKTVMNTGGIFGGSFGYSNHQTGGASYSMSMTVGAILGGSFNISYNFLEHIMVTITGSGPKLGFLGIGPTTNILGAGPSVNILGSGPWLNFLGSGPSVNFKGEPQ